jgi:hypothetical protein
MTQPLFKIGSVYRDGKDRVIKLIPYGDSSHPDWCIAMAESEGGGFSDNAWAGDGARRLSDGRYVHDHRNDRDDIALIPGELHQVDGAWVPITEQPMSVYFADAVEGGSCYGEHDGPDAYAADEAFRAALARDAAADSEHFANAAMIARDGPAAPKPAVVALPAAPTAHPAINGLTFLGAVDHRFGLSANKHI